MAASGHQSWAQAGSRPAARMSLRPPGASSAALPQIQELGWGGHQVREVCVGTTVALGEGCWLSLISPYITVTSPLEVKDYSLQMMGT